MESIEDGWNGGLLTISSDAAKNRHLVMPKAKERGQDIIAA